MRRTAIVTGSDSGIGEATAVVLAEHGYDVGITWHTDERGAQSTADSATGAGAGVAVRRLDVADHEAAPAVIRALVDDLGGLDAFVNVAGVGSSTAFLDLSLAEWQHVLDVDLTGAFVCAQAAARVLVEQRRGGRIVNVTSVHEHVPLRNSGAYCAAKGGLGLLTKVMALELAEHGVTVNGVAPGEIATAMTGQEDVDPATLPRAAIPAGRPGHAREVAGAIAWLASPEASYVTGTSFVVDGGMLLMAAQANVLVGEK